MLSIVLLLHCYQPHSFQLVWLSSSSRFYDGYRCRHRLR
uniref:Uncharacterized protein n=1 Tax=Anguilla anguilla TaxID=7936 RepID=A0A0E9QZ86_ANGAN